MAWARWQDAWWLILPSAGVLAWVLNGRTQKVLLSGVGLVFILGTLLGFVFHLQHITNRPLEGQNPSMLADRIYTTLERRFDDLLDSGDRAVQETIELLEDSEGSDLQTGLSRIRRRKGITALAVYDQQGRMQAWVGVHRGPVPQEIRRANPRYAFSGGPLFRYLYFTAPDPVGGGTVVAAALLQTNLPAGLEEAGFAARFQRETGVPIRILPPDRAQGPVPWLVSLEDEPFLYVEPGVVDSEDAWADRMGFWIRTMALLAVLAWAGLTLGGRGIPRWNLWGGISLGSMAVLLPVQGLWPGEGLSSPGHFLIPLLGWPLGKFLGVLLALGLLCGLLLKPGKRPLGALAGALLIAVGYPVLDLLFRESASASLFSIGLSGWLPYQASLALALSLLGCLGLGARMGREVPEEGGRLLLLGAGVLALALAVLGALLAQRGPGLSPWYLALWALPVFMAQGGAGVGRGRQGVLFWLTAALMGSSAALPAAWGTSIESQMTVAEAELQNLGADPDPFLEFRLLHMAETVDSLDGMIRDPVELLFEVWSQTGQRGDPLAMWLTLWDAGDLPTEDLAMGVQGNRPPYADDYLDQVRSDPLPIVRHLGLANARYVLLVPLTGRRVLTAVVPPRGSMSLASPKGPIFAALERSSAVAPTLVPADPEDLVEGERAVVWERREDGWHGRWILEYIDGALFATRTVSVPGVLHMVARGTLNLILNLILVLLLWGTGRLMARGQEIQVRQLLRVMGSFRARVTMALFGFFFLSIAIFGTLAFKTLSDAAQRTASALAERIVEDGANFYNDANGSMQLLAREVGADLLEYRDGELREGSADELVRLGLYEGWIPEPLFRDLEGRRELRRTHQSSLGGWQYLMAYRRLEDHDMLATPVPMEAGATVLRRQEVVDLLGFAIILGAALSLVLALWVGRTLSRPIETLQIASERVGSGNLRVKLPEDRRDEFGSVFGAFNRMVLGIRRARRALLRTTRRTQAIMEEIATGVVALDASGRVTLMNPGAEALLGEKVVVGESLPGRSGDAGELVRWVDLYFRDGLLAANKEFQLGPRRIRIKARRVSEESPIGGAVLSLEDVTDELRSERILAWGEMARQVAHEVKNPLTPMKLSVQHLQRAWEDRRPDFHEILGRNVEIMLKEIDHLAAIARSFSRFGAPEATGDLPLRAVSIQSVVQEVMNLYGGGKGALSFRSSIPSDLPAIRAREAELREVLINLLENSRAAIPFQGEVGIEAKKHTLGVELRVRDDGTGVDPDLLARVFEPHFSTRSAGTGLGLAIVRRLVESWGGTISAESEVGKGTVMRIVAPAWDGSRGRETQENEVVDGTDGEKGDEG
jgi:two-component system nitrogen regulation sensor histidine kinase NtrY